MKSKTSSYPGLDYSRGASNCDASNGIRYGVVSQNSVNSDALDDIFTHGTDMAWDEALAEAVKEARTEAESIGEDADEAVNEDDVAEGLSMNWETSLGNYLYESEGYKLTGCLDNDLFVLKSRFYTFAQFCSPCVPGAGNLDNAFDGGAQSAQDASFPRTYCLGHDWFENGRAPYAVYSVETNEAVMPE